MPDLSPAPSTLGLSSPVLGPWFERSSADGTDLPAMALPDADLGCPLSLPNGAIWNAPAAGLLSFLVATRPRPAALAALRQANGQQAFTDGALVLLFTLLPEVASRLAVLSHAVPRPDSTVPALAGQATRVGITHLAMELPASSVGSLAQLGQVLPHKDAADLHTLFAGLATDADKARFLGLDAAAGLGNASRAATILRRPEKNEARLLENQSGAPLPAKLWAFDRQGRPVDAGTVATIWAHLAGTLWDNLWASRDSARQRTADAQAGKVVHLVNAHEGPLESALKARVAGQLTDLAAVDSSDVLFLAASSPAIGLSAVTDANTDTAPLPRLAPLPAGPYLPLDSATPFAGWGASGALSRDFLRVALADLESLSVGLTRTAGTAQADPRRRVSPARNTAASVFLPTVDAVAREVMTRLSAATSTVQFLAPELDLHWGPQTTATIGGGNPFDPQWDAPGFTAHALKGAGQVTAGVAQGQAVVVHFDASLPPTAWIRLWPHGRDSETGRRFRMTGAAGRVDSGGSALVRLPLPDGQNGPDQVFSFDLWLVTDTGTRLYTDLRAARPVVAGGGELAITALAAGQSLYAPQQGATVAAGTGALPPGDPVIVVTGAVSDHDFATLDTSSLRPQDLSAALINSASTGDTLVTRPPAFRQTTEGDLSATPWPGGPARIHGSSFHAPGIGQDMHDFAAYDTNSHQGVIGGLTGRAPWHEAPPAARAHAGVSAGPDMHGSGVALAGPAADGLRLLMRERAVDGIAGFLAAMGVPFTAAVAPAGPGVWTALLETAAKGTHGHLLMSLIPAGFGPGKAWDNADPADPGIKQQIDQVLASLPGGLTTDALIDSTTFEDSTAAAAFDRVLDKHRNGVQGFARAALAAIGRAEDLVWLQTPALDNEGFAHAAGDIHLLNALAARLAAQPALHCLIVLPEKHLPDRNLKLDQVRQSAIGAALQALQAAAPDRVAWVSPSAGPGRPFHMASTTLVVDDVLLLTGGAHTWRRGLVFDSALSAAVFDEVLQDGRPAAVAAARRLLAGAMLGVDPAFVPSTAADLVAAVKALNAGGGFGRTQPATHVPRVDTTPAAEKAVWNPALSADTDWTATLAALVGNVKTEFDNGVR